MEEIPRTQSTAQMFKKCNKKIPEFEQYLTGESSRNQQPIHPRVDGFRRVQTNNNIYFTPEHGKSSRRRRGIVDNMSDDSVRVLNYDEGREAHAVIIVKNQYLPEKWSFFDANGIDGFKDNILVFVDDDDYDVTDNFLVATPETAFNSGYYYRSPKEKKEKKPARELPDDINPGFCGIFGIIFMVFYNNNKTNPKWVSMWHGICDCFLTTYTHDKRGKYKYALVVANKVLEIVNKNIKSTQKEEEILQVIHDSCSSAPMRAKASGIKKKTKKKSRSKSKTKKSRSYRRRR